MKNKLLAPVLLASILMFCQVFYSIAKCPSDSLCGENCDRPCIANKTLPCPFGFYKFGELCFPTSTEVCPENTTLTSSGCKPTNELCPPKFLYLNGVCVNSTVDNSLLSPSLCSPGMVLFNGTCVSTDIASCPLNFTLENGICVRMESCNGTSCGLNSCPFGMVLINNTCITLTCPEGAFKINGICAKCPVNSHFYNGQCIQCPVFMTFSNGLCVCPIAGHVVHNNSCIDIYILLQIPKNFTNNTIPTINVTNNTLPTEIFIHNVSNPHLDDGSKNKLNITNKVNSTDFQNIHTKANGTNLNNVDGININTPIKQGVNTKPKIKHRPPKYNDCCIVIHPRNCRHENEKWVCTKRRYHVCGIECARQRNHTLPKHKVIEVPMPIQPHNLTPQEPSNTNGVPVQISPPQLPMVPFVQQMQPAMVNTPLVVQNPQVYYQEQPAILYQEQPPMYDYGIQPQFQVNDCTWPYCT